MPIINEKEKIFSATIQTNDGGSIEVSSDSSIVFFKRTSKNYKF